MSAADNLYEPDNYKGPIEGETLQANASTPNQSDSPIASERNDAAVEGIDPRRNTRKRKAHTLCQVCQVILKDEKPYYQRYRICPTCSSIDRTDDTDGLLKRFCQQCGKFHNITLFDGSMRTCRERLDRHAARRRKSHARQAVIRRGSPMDDIYVPGRRDTSSLPQQRRQNTQIPRYDVEQVQPSYLQQQQQQQHAVSNPMLDLAHQILQHSAAGQRSLLEQQRAIQHYEQQQQQQQQMLEHLVVSMASARPSPENLLNPLYTPTPLRFGPSQHPQNFVGPSTIDPTAAATKMKAVLAVLLNEAAATAAPPPPPQQQNGTEALQSMLQRLVAIAASGSGGNKSGVGGANAAPRFLPPAPRLSMVNALNTIAPPTIAAAPAVKTTTTSNEFAVLPSSLPSEITELAPQLRAALEALLKYEQGTPQL